MATTWGDGCGWGPSAGQEGTVCCTGWLGMLHVLLCLKLTAIAAHRPLHAPLAALLQMLDALVVLRDSRIIHCDLKPENVSDWLWNSCLAGDIRAALARPLGLTWSCPHTACGLQVLLKNVESGEIKIIDFGSGAWAPNICALGCMLPGQAGMVPLPSLPCTQAALFHSPLFLQPASSRALCTATSNRASTARQRWAVGIGWGRGGAGSVQTVRSGIPL